MPTAKVSVTVKDSKKAEDANDDSMDKKEQKRVIDLRSSNGNGSSGYNGNGQYRSSRDVPNMDEENGNGRDVPTQEVRGILDITHDGHGFFEAKIQTF